MDKPCTEFDYLLVGGGLQNGLLAVLLRHLQPGVRVGLVERGALLGGNHTWCFHSDDVSPEVAAAIDPLVVHRWPGYEVSFPRHHRVLDTPYAAVTSERLARVVDEAVRRESGSAVLLEAEAIEVGARSVTLADGRALRASVVVDARGPERAGVADETSGYQKFVGIEVEAPDHGIELPVLMDARVEQLDGFRFVYVLPLGPDRLLLEDTRFSDGPALEVDALMTALFAYASERELRIAAVERVEKGVLPLPWSSDVVVPDDDSPITAGFQGGWFHPVTGYSFPVAARLAHYIASTPVDQVRGEGLARLAADQRKQLAFCHRLNKMLFTWFAPEQRFNVLERFYTLPEPLIRRFYAMQMSGMDRARIFFGRPPRGMSYRAALFGRSPV